ncbi:hypothetical protein CFB50_29910 [Burkholderia sp. AU33423]|nr:hypothetical protein CFB50_29910 [Burkholderia sp. AU33423]
MGGRSGLTLADTSVNRLAVDRVEQACVRAQFAMPAGLQQAGGALACTYVHASRTDTVRAFFNLSRSA